MGVATFFWKDTRKECSMFWLRNWSYSLRAFLQVHCYLTFWFFIAMFDSVCFLFKSVPFSNLVGWYYYSIIFPSLELNFFKLQNWKKNSSTRKRNYCVLLKVRLRKVKKFPVHGRISEVDSGLFSFLYFILRALHMEVSYPG